MRWGRGSRGLRKGRHEIFLNVCMDVYTSIPFRQQVVEGVECMGDGFR